MFTFSLDDLSILDGYYQGMHAQLRDVHEAAFADIAESGCDAIAEIACGTACNEPLARLSGLTYTGIDICETAIAASCLKWPQSCFLNLSIEQTALLAERSFDAVYCSSMLEHVGRVEEAIHALWRLARCRLDLVFYEGLSDSERHVFKFVPYDDSQPPREWGGRYGMKVALQDHGIRDGRKNGSSVPGYFLNRFALTETRAFLNDLPGAGLVEIRSFPSNRSWATISRAIAQP